MLGFGWLIQKIPSTIFSQTGLRSQNWEDWYCPETWETTDILWEEATMTTCSVYNNNLNNWETVVTNWESA